jgi:dihydrofolate synthase/folylpolyglutamate synthase
VTARRSTPARTAYAEALGRLYVLQTRGMRFGESRMRHALALRHHPESGQRFVHVGGTNGKGSVSAMIAACLQAAGHRTGLFTSPHVHRYVERVRVDGRCISDREACRRITELLEASRDWEAGEHASTFFELTTLLALESFRDHRCDVAVLEVGLGGRLDATNAVTPEVSVITRIALDHTQILGDTLAEIAEEKAGIQKRGVPAVIGVRDPEALAVITRRARAVGAPCSLLDRDFGAERMRDGRARVWVGKRVLAGLPAPLPGDHQLDNLACAVAALLCLDPKTLRVPRAAIERGLSRLRWPARLEHVRGAPSVLLDAAHNPDGAAALAAHLTRLEKRGPRALVFGSMADKDYGAMLRALAPCFDRVFVCRPRDLPRTADLRVMQAHAQVTPTRSASDALVRAQRAVGPSGLVVVAGSIYLVAELRAKLLGLRSDPPIRM